MSFLRVGRGVRHREDDFTYAREREEGEGREQNKRRIVAREGARKGILMDTGMGSLLLGQIEEVSLEEVSF